MSYSILMGEQGRQATLDRLEAEHSREVKAHPVEATAKDVTPAVTEQQANDNQTTLDMLATAVSRAAVLIASAGERDMISINLSGNCGQINRQQVVTEHFYVGIQAVS